MSTLNTEVKQYIFDLTYYANQDKAGVEMFEIKLNCYTGINKNKVYSYGVQLINPKSMTSEYYQYKKEDKLFEWHNNEYYAYAVDMSKCQVTYFNSDDKVSYNATSSLNENKYPYVIDIEDKLYAFKFDKLSYNGYVQSVFGHKTHYYYKSSFEYFVFKMYSSMSNLSGNEGIYENLNVSLNDVFQLYEYNEATKKFDILNEEFGYNAEYMGVKIKYVKRGATMHEDSMFNKIGAAQKGGVIYG